MTDFLSRELPKPKNWQDFEILTYDVFSRAWKTSDAQLNGRQGQPQAGVDVYGTDRVEDKFTGVQCKGKDSDYGGKLKPAELEAEVQKARSFQPPIDVFVVVTTAPNDVDIQTLARELTAKHRKLGLFEVRVQGWDTFRQLISDHPEVVRKHFQDFAPVDLLGEYVAGRAEDRESFAQLTKLVRQVQSSQTRTLDVPDDSSPLAGRVTEIAKLIESGSPKTALKSLQRLRDEVFDAAPPLIKFRITANRAAAHFALGEDDVGKPLLEEAYRHYPEYPNARATMALFHHLNGDDAAARELAEAALKDDPKSSRAAGVVIDTSPDLTVDQLLETLPEPLLEKVEIQLQLAYHALTIGRDDLFLTHAERALAIAPDDWRAMGAVAEAIMLPINAIEGVALTRALPDELKGNLERAIDLFRRAWTELRNHDSGAQGPHIAANLIGLLKVSGREEEADEVLETAVARNPDYPPLTRRFAQREAGLGNWHGVRSALDGIPGRELEFDDHMLKTQASIKLADHSRAVADIAALDAAVEEDEQREFVAAFQVEVDVLGGVPLQDAFDGQVKRFPSSIIMRSILFDWLPDDEVMKEMLAEEIRALAQHELGLRSKAHAAETLFSASEYGIAADLFAGLHGNDVDSFALYRHLQSLHLAGRRKEARALFESLPETIKHQAQYASVGVNIYERAGLLKAALALLEKIFPKRDELRDRLAWANLLIRLNRTDQLVAWLKQLPMDVNGSPQELMALAELVSDYLKDRELALALGYRALQDGYSDPQVHLSFALGLMVMGEAGSETKGPGVAGVGAGVVLHNAASTETRWYLLVDGDAKTERGELPISSAIGSKLNGLKRRDMLEIDKLGDEPERFTVQEVQSKYVFAFQRTIRDFERMFPGHPGFGTFNIDESKGPGKFDQLFSMARRRAAFGAQIEERYQSGMAPLFMLSKLSGSSVFDLWEGLRRAPGGSVKVAQGLDAELALGRAAAARGLSIVDPLSVYAWAALGLEETVSKFSLSLGIVQSALDMLRELVEEREGQRGKKMGTFGWDGQHYQLIELDEEAIENQIQVARRALALATTIPLVPAEAAEPLEADVAEVLQNMHTSLLDTLSAARGDHRALLTDDFALRIMSQQLGISVTWTQATLQYQSEADAITTVEYRSALDVLLAAHYEFTTFNHADVLAALQEANWLISDQVQRFIDVIVGPTAGRPSVVISLASVLLGSNAIAPSDEAFAAFHLKLVDTLGAADRLDYGQALYVDVLLATESLAAVRVRAVELPALLLSSTSHTSPEYLSRPLNERAKLFARSIEQRLDTGGLPAGSWRK